MTAAPLERIAEVLALATDKLEAGWTTGAAARDALGRERDPKSAQACSWCSVGAIEAVAERGVADDARGAYSDFLYQRFGVGGIADWNDNHCPDQAAAVATMRAAARRAASVGA